MMMSFGASGDGSAYPPPTQHRPPFGRGSSAAPVTPLSVLPGVDCSCLLCYWWGLLPMIALQVYFLMGLH